MPLLLSPLLLSPLLLSNLLPVSNSNLLSREGLKYLCDHVMQSCEPLQFCQTRIVPLLSEHPSENP